MLRLDPKVAKPKKSSVPKGESSPEPISVKIPADVVISARTIAGIENRAIADVIAEAARESLRKMEKAALDRRRKEVGE